MYHFENRYQHQDGTYRWLSWNAYPAVEQQILFCIARDVTEQKRAEEALRASEARFRSFMEFSPILAWIVSPDGRFLFSNHGFARLLKTSNEEVERSTVQDIFPPEYAAEYLANNRRVLEAAAPIETIERSPRQDGTEGVFLAYKFPLPNPDGSQQIGGVAVDITEQKRAEVALRESEERLRLALTAGRMGIFDWDPAKNVVVWSDTHYELFGYPAGERFPVEYHHFADRVHPDDLPTVEQAIRTAMDQRVIYTNEYRLLLPAGTVRWILSTGAFQYDSDARPVRMLGTIKDITDRKHAEAELVMRDQAIQAVNQGIVITDATLPDNPIAYVGPGFERLTGYSSTEAVGRNCRFLQGPDTDKTEVARIAAAIRDGVPYSCELLNYRKDCNTFWNELSITPVRDPAGRLINFVGIQTDVTARRTLEDQLRQAQKMEAVGQLAGGVAHDFNNLLTVINGYSEMLLMEMSPDHPQRDPLAGIREAGERAAALTQQLLAFSRRTIVVPRVLDVNELIASSSKMLRRLIGEDITLATVLSPAPCYVRIDPGQLEQVVMNLVVNARDAMPKGGRITFETNPIDLLEPNPDCPAGRYIRLAVTDTGTGMTEEVKSRLFEPFFTTKGVGKGTGLGLAMVYGVVRQAGGSVQIESTVGRGTTFTLLLPEVPAAAADRTAGVMADVAPRGTETILLVEDEDGVRAFSRLVLEMQGYTVVEAESGTEAISKATSYPETIHLMVTDVVMPDLGGRELTVEIRRLRPAVRLLYVSGYTSDAVVRHGVEEETDAFLQKPFTPLSLARKVREVLDAPRPE